MLTLPHLTSLSSPASFERGEKLFEKGAVIRLVKMGKVFESEVQGTFRYQQTWDLRREDLVAVCSCPYAQGGICKHLVAAGLAIAKEAFTEVRPGFEEGGVPEAKGFFESTWEPAEDRIKALFLRQAFSKNPRLRSQFQSFLQQEGPSPSFEDIEAIRKKVHQALETLSFDGERDVDWDYYYQNRKRYLDEGSFVEELAAQKLEEELHSYLQRMQRYLEQGNMVDALKLCLGMYEGTFGLDTPVNDNFGVYSHYSQQLQQLCFQVLGELLSGLQSFIIGYGSTQRLIQLIFERWSQYESSYQKGQGGRYLLPMFFPILKALAYNEVTARQLDTRLQGYQLFGVEMAPLHLHIARQTGDEARWEKTAEKAFHLSSDVSTELIAHYQEAGRHEDFLRVAKKAFRIFPEKLGAFLFDQVRIEQDRELFKSLLKARLTQTKSLDLYREWRVLATTEEVDQLLHASTYPPDWYILLLTEEARFEDLLTFAKKAISPSNILQVLPPLVDQYPDFCFDALSQEIADALSQSGDRKKYHYACQLMRLLLLIPGYEDQGREIIQHAYAYRRPTLQDEMRKAGLV